MISGYISGSWDHFGQRLHQFCTGINDLEKFRIEGSQYTGINAIVYTNITGGILTTGSGSISKNTKHHWSDEFSKKARLYHFPTGAVFP